MLEVEGEIPQRRSPGLCMQQTFARNSSVEVHIIKMAANSIQTLKK